MITSWSIIAEEVGLEPNTLKGTNRLAEDMGVEPIPPFWSGTH